MSRRDPRVRPAERAAGTAVLALAALALLAAAWVGPWFAYDFSSGRQTPPDGAYNRGEDAIVRHSMTYTATGWTGDAEPEPGLADRLAFLLPLGLGVASACLLAVALGEVPRLHRFVPRRLALALVGVALAAILATATAGWVWMPESMASYGVGSPFTARLDEPSGYTKTALAWGWYALAATLLPAVGAGLVKFQAGAVDLRAVSGLLNAPEDRA